MIAAARRRGLLHGGAALAGLFASLVLFWPGIALFDTIYQFQEIVDGSYDDWHPPIMARLWSLLLGPWPPTAPMLLLQLGLLWLGLGLLAAAFARRGRWTAGWAILAAGAATFLSCWMGAILKDGQMVGALAAAAGIAGWYRLGDRRLSVWAGAVILVLLAYAAMVRANAVFAVVPLGLGLFGWIGVQRTAARAAAVVATTVAIILVSPPINRHLLGAERSGVENSLLLYDIAGAAIRSGADDVAGVPAHRWREAAAKGCYSPIDWGQLGEPRCTVDPRLTPAPDSRPLYGLWVATILRHPLGYALHRLAHFNATMRLFVPRNLPTAMSPVDSDSNALGLGAEPSDIERAFWTLGTVWTSLPLAWPCFWLALAAVALWPAAQAPEGPERNLALAFLLSACCGGVSYAAISVASDLRYHLWTMLAAAIGIAALAGAGVIKRRHLLAFAAVGAAVILIGTAGRLLLPPLPPIV